MSQDSNLQIIEGNTPAKNLNRLHNIEENIKAVRAEFIGKPEVCHMLVAEIIKLRRNPGNQTAREEFWDLLNIYTDVILEHYDVRWLLSICDTIVDIGSELKSAIAMNMVQCVNGTNIHHTLLVNAVDGNIDANKLRHEIKVPTWGGMITADIPNGDMIHNMMNRLDAVIEQEPLLNKIWCRIKDIGREENNLVLNHFCNASNQEHQRKFFK
tara:strand:+ start:65 stop:700 length:636 start_codon:yes stop_codon:yes gene_type:complete